MGCCRQEIHFELNNGLSDNLQPLLYTFKIMEIIPLTIMFIVGFILGFGACIVWVKE